MIKFSMRDRGLIDRLGDILHSRRTRAEIIVAEQVMKDTERYVPMQTGSLRMRTRLEGHQIVYPGPYARMLYYGKVMVDSETGKGPMYIPGIGYRYRKGATLVPSNRDLTFHTPGTCSHWFEASKAMNAQKWERVAERAMTNAK